MLQSSLGHPWSCQLRPLLCGLACLAFFTACKSDPTREEVLEEYRSSAAAKLEKLSKIAALVKAQAPLSKGSTTMMAPPDELTVCPYHYTDERNCNTEVIYLRTLEAPDEWRDYWDFVKFHDPRPALVTQLLEKGKLVESERNHHVKLRDEDLKNPKSWKDAYEDKWKGIHPKVMKEYFEQLDATKYVLVFRAESDRYHSSVRQMLFEGDLFLYEVDSQKCYGGAAIEASWKCHIRDFVVASGPNMGAYAGSTKCTRNPAYGALHTAIKRAIPDASLPELPD